MNKIEISNLDLHYGSFHALKNINLKIQEKEITAFIGPYLSTANAETIFGLLKKQKSDEAIKLKKQIQRTQK